MAYALDTHAAVQDLTAAGFAPEQAEAIVATVARSESGLATKADVAVVKSDLAVVKSDLEAAITALEVRLVKWGIGIGLAIAGLLFAALRLFG